MKKIIIPLLLIISSLASLTACGQNVREKNYKKEVSTTNFIIEYSKIYKSMEDRLLSGKEDSVCISSYSSKATKTTLNKVFSKKIKGTMTTSWNIKSKFDSDNFSTIYKYTYKNKANKMKLNFDEVTLDNDYKSKEITKKKIFYGRHEEVDYAVDLYTKDYQKSYSPLLDHVNVCDFLRPNNISEESTCYIDGNVYTIIVENETTYKLRQYTIQKNGISEYYEYVRKSNKNDADEEWDYKDKSVLKTQLIFKKVNNGKYVISDYLDN